MPGHFYRMPPGEKQLIRAFCEQECNGGQVLMARNISISVSVQDQYSQSISAMREKTVAFNKDIEELTAKIKSLNKEKISLNIDAVKAQQTLRDLQQQFKNTGNAADQMVLQLANANYSNVNKQIERISKSSQQAKRELSNLVN